MEKKKLSRTKPLHTVEAMEQAVERLNSRSTTAPEPPAAAEKALYSYNVKLDEQTEQRVKTHIARTGQNMKGFFQTAIREYLERNGA